MPTGRDGQQDDSRQNVVEVTFSCGEDAIGPLTWSQAAIGAPIAWFGEQAVNFNMARAVAVAPGVALTDVLDVVRTALERFEGLRTLYYVTPERRCQHRLAQGTVVVFLREVSGEDPAQEAQALRAALRSQLFRQQDLPIRFGLVLDGGRPTHLVFAVSRQAVDGAALTVLADWFAATLQGGARSGDPVVRQPLDRARAEAEPSYARVAARALKYWRRALTTVPPAMLGPAVGGPDEPFVQLGLRSPAAAVAATRISARLDVPTSTVLLALSAAVLASVVDQPVVALKVIVSNRFDEGSRDLVAPMAQDALVLLDVSDGTVDDLVVHAQDRAFLGYANARYDPAALAEILEDVATERAVPLHLTAYHNDVRSSENWSALPEVQGDDALRALTASSTAWHVGTFRRQDNTYFLTVLDHPGALEMNLLADTEYLSRPAVAACLSAMEALLVEASCGPLPLQRVREHMHAELSKAAAESGDGKGAW